MKLLPSLFILAALLAPLPLRATIEHPTEEEIKNLIDLNYKRYRDIAVDVIKKCPPPKCRYVGLGRSPTPVMALLESLEPGAGANVPLALSKVNFADLTPALKKELFDHFDRFMPDLASLGSKELLLVDYVSSGDSLLKSGKLLQEYAAYKGYTGKISLYAFGARESLEQTRAKNFGSKFTLHEFKPAATSQAKLENLWDTFIYQSFDDYSEFPSYQPGKGAAPTKVTQGGYQSIRDYMNAKALEDTHSEVVKRKTTIAGAPVQWVDSTQASGSTRLSALFNALGEMICEHKK